MLLGQTVRGCGVIAVFGLASLGVRAAEPALPPAAELSALLARHAEYAGLSPEQRTRTKRPESDQPPLSKEAAAAWKRGLWAAWREQLAGRKPDKLPQPLGFPQGWLKPESGVTVGVVQADWWKGPGRKSPRHDAVRGADGGHETGAWLAGVHQPARRWQQPAEQ